MRRYCAYIGLGSNLHYQSDNHTHDSQTLMRQSAQQLRLHGVVAVSSLYRSLPMGPQDQPDYLNAVLSLQTDLSPIALLAVLQDLELVAGRVRVRRWGERTLDLDILAMFDNQQSQIDSAVIMQTPTLTLPHVGVLQRSFVVIPLLELDPTLIISGQKLIDCDHATDTTLIKLAEPAIWFAV